MKAETWTVGYYKAPDDDRYAYRLAASQGDSEREAARKALLMSAAPQLLAACELAAAALQGRTDARGLAALMACQSAAYRAVRSGRPRPQSWRPWTDGASGGLAIGAYAVAGSK